MKIKIVCGPPGSGKTSYVKKHMAWGDLVIDFDSLFSAISFLPYHEKPKGLFGYVAEIRQLLYTLIQDDESDRRAWVIMGGAKKMNRNIFDDAQIIMLNLHQGACLQNIKADPDRSKNWEQYISMVTKWWNDYEAD